MESPVTKSAAWWVTALRLNVIFAPAVQPWRTHAPATRLRSDTVAAGPADAAHTAATLNFGHHMQQCCQVFNSSVNVSTMIECR